MRKGNKVKVLYRAYEENGSLEEISAEDMPKGIGEIKRIVGDDLYEVKFENISYWLRDDELELVTSKTV